VTRPAFAAGLQLQAMSEPRIRFTNTVADLLAFQDYHVATDEKAQRMVLRARLIGAVAVAVLVGVYSFLASKNFVATVPLALVSGVAFAILFPRLVRQRMQRQIRARHAQGRDKKFTCQHTMTVHDGQLTVTTPFENTVVPLDQITRIDRTESHGFIRIGELGGYIVPLMTEEGDASAFLSLLSPLN
jgi:hypothetical protein